MQYDKTWNGMEDPFVVFFNAFFYLVDRKLKTNLIFLL